MVLKSKFTGLIVPVFAPFNENGQLDVSQIPKYAQYLHSQKVNGILVGGTCGEGLLMSNDERKKLAEAWMSATKNTGQQIMLQVGGTNMNNVIELTKHAEAIGVWSILCLPDLLYRPATTDALIQYLKMVSAAAPNTPLFYYHYPDFFGINLDMIKFLNDAYSEIPTLSGLKYSTNNLHEALRLVQLRDRAFTIFLSTDQLISAAYCMGIDSMILVVLNYGAHEVHAIKENVESGRIAEAQKHQNRIRSLLEFVTTEMRFEYGIKSIISLVAGLKLGNPRPPLPGISSEELSKLKTYLKQNKWL